MPFHEHVLIYLASGSNGLPSLFETLLGRTTSPSLIMNGNVVAASRKIEDKPMINETLIQKRNTRDRQIVELALSDRTLLLRDIAAAIPCSRTVVVAVLRAAGITRKEGRPARKHEQS